MKWQVLVGQARLARISRWLRRFRQVTPQPVEDNVFGPNLSQAKQQPVPSRVASPGRGRVDARRWPKTTSWDAGCRTRVRLGQNLFQGHETTTRRKRFWIMSPLVSAFVFLSSLWVQSHRPAMFPCTAPETHLQDFLACEPCRGHGLGQRLGRNSRGAIPDRRGTKTSICSLHLFSRPRGETGG